MSSSCAAESPPYPTHTLPIPPYTQVRSFSILIQFSLRLAATPPDDMPTPRPPPTESYVDSRFSEFRRKHKDDRKFLSPSFFLHLFAWASAFKFGSRLSPSLYIYLYNSILSAGRSPLLGTDRPNVSRLQCCV